MIRNRSAVEQKAIHSKGHWSKALPLTREEVSTIPNESGIYQLENKNKTPIYVGVAHKGDYSGLRHRLHSYHEKDNYDHKNGHPTKKVLRGKATKFQFNEMPIAQARVLEHKMKQDMAYNADNKTNEAKKHHKVVPI